MGGKLTFAVIAAKARGAQEADVTKHRGNSRRNRLTGFKAPRLNKSPMARAMAQGILGARQNERKLERHAFEIEKGRLTGLTDPELSRNVGSAQSLRAGERMDKTMFARQLARSMAGTSDGILKYAEHPVGRGVSAERKARASWIATLDDDRRRWLHQLVEEGAHSGVFGVLCVLDHVRFLEDAEEKGSFTLIYTSPSGAQTQINPEEGEMLHDLFNGFSRDAQK